MDEPVHRALIAAGWYPGRNIALDDNVRTLSENGYQIWPQLLAFIREYGDLTISFRRNDRDDSAWFEPKRACAWIEHSWVAHYQERVNTRLTPIGYAYHDHMALLAAENGEYFGGYDDYLARIGTSVDSMLSNLINQSIVEVPSEQGELFEVGEQRAFVRSFTGLAVSSRLALAVGPSRRHGITVDVPRWVLCATSKARTHHWKERSRQQ